MPDEFITGSIGNEGHHEGSTESITAKENIENLLLSISKIVSVAERHIERSQKIGEGRTAIPIGIMVKPSKNCMIYILYILLLSFNLYTKA